MSTTIGNGAQPRDTLSADAFSSMFQSVAGLRNMRAASAMLGCFVLAVVASGLLWMLLGRGGAAFLVSGLLALALIATGVHAAGVLLMDQARQIPMRTVSDAIVYGMWCIPKSIVLTLAMAIAFVAVYVVLYVLYFICKMPGLGPLLYAIVFPVSVIAAGLAFSGLFVGSFMALAAIWEGATISGALAKAWGVLRYRLVETVLLSIVVMVLSSLVFSFVAGVLMTGFWPALGLSMSTIGESPRFLDAMGSSMMMGSMGRGGMGGYALAGMFGSAMLLSLMMTLVLQVWLLGISLVFLRVTEGLDVSVTEEALQARLAEARQKAADMGHKAKEAAERARAQATQAMEERKVAAAAASQARSAPDTVALQDNEAMPFVQAPAVEPARAPTCPACSATISASDRFCGECGHPLAP